MPARVALAAVLLLVLLAAPLRTWLERPAPSPHGCVPEGRGEPPRHHLGCAADPGPPRPLAGDERLLLGLPLDPNTAGVQELSFVPGLTRSVAAEVVKDRARNGPYAEVSDLLRVRGIGPKRLAAAAPHLEIARRGDGAARGVGSPP